MATRSTTKSTTTQRQACWDNEITGFVKSITQVCPVTGFTDGTGTSGYMDFTDALPVGALVLGWKAVTATAGAWDDDTTAVLMVGKSGDTNFFSGVENGSVAAAGTIYSICDDNATVFITAATTPRVTVTGSSDFTAFVTAATPSSTVTIYYIELL
jgi:hypothetical protein